MQTLFEIYRLHVNKESDISQHLEILSRLASLCDHVTEFGVRRGSSTIALLYGKPKKLASYDICDFKDKELYYNIAKQEGVEFEFAQKDTTKMEPINPTDLLFIDTIHTYIHLRAELSIHAGQVSRYLAVHDTTKYGDRGQDGKEGIWLAISDFVKQNRHWLLWQYFSHNNGLTILRRSSPSCI